MPLQNRVTPFGELVAHPSKASTLIGNRGIIHDPGTRALTGRRWTTKSWIACALAFKGRHRDVWASRSWTELFFLDEVTALAAGHRPCFECRRDAARAFADAWAIANGGTKPRAVEMDDVLHRERIDGRHRRLHPVPGELSRLPDGVMVASGSSALLRHRGQWLHWTFDGYAAVGSMPKIDGMLTPPSIVRVLDAGYRPQVHASAG